MARMASITTLAVCALLGASVVPAMAADGNPRLGVSDADLVWDDVALGTSVSKTLTVRNSGGGELAVAAPRVGGVDAADFSVPSTNCAGARLAAGEACTVQVAFAPTALSTRVAHLAVLTSDSRCTSFVTLAGSGAERTSPQDPQTRRGFSRDCAASAASPQAPGTSTSPSSTTAPTSDGGVLGTSQAGGGTSCKSRRLLRININPRARRKFEKGSLKVTTKGRTFGVKRYKTGKRKGRYYADLSFRGLKIGRYAVRIRAKYTSGGTYARTRHFVTCVAGTTP